MSIYFKSHIQSWHLFKCMYIYIFSVLYILLYVFMTSLYMYYALSFVLVEHSVCHEPIFVLINIFTGWPADFQN